MVTLSIQTVMHEKQRFTELRETQEALRASEQRWRDLIEALQQLVWSAMPRWLL